MKTIPCARFTKSLVATAVIALGAAGSAQGTIISFDNDSEFLGSGFSKVAGVNIRWGDSGGSAEWEFSVVDSGDMPQDQKQVTWSDHGVPELNVDFDDQGIFADLGSTSGDIAESSWFSALGGYNTVLFRAKATNSLTVTDILVNDIVLGGLAGDSDAQYIGITMDEFLSGSLSFNFTADPGSRSDPGLQVKFGSLPTASVSEPGTFGLLALGLGGILAASRRRAGNN